MRYHGLRGSASPVLTATGLVNGRWQFSTSPPQNPHPLTDHQKLVASDYVGDPYGCGKFGAKPQKLLKRWHYSASRWHLGDAMVGNITFCWFFLAVLYSAKVVTSAALGPGSVGNPWSQWWRRKGRLQPEGIAEKEGFERWMKEWGGDGGMSQYTE